jgi:hypothetical protein
MDEEKRQRLAGVLNFARGATFIAELLSSCCVCFLNNRWMPAEEVRKTRKKVTKNDNAIRLASILHDVRTHALLFYLVYKQDGFLSDCPINVLISMLRCCSRRMYQCLQADLSSSMCWSHDAPKVY